MRPITVLFVAVLTSLGAAAQVTGSRVAVPGTGVKLIPPPGLTVARAGATLIDSSGQTIVNFIMSEPRLALDNDPTWRAIFPHSPEVTTGHLAGKLYRRTRSADGGGWDGWLLSVPREGKVLTVMAMYTGESSQAFDRIRDHLFTTTWDEKIADPETALGVSMSPPGLQLVRGTYGGLAYNTTGKVGAPGPMVLAQFTPVPPSKIDALFPAGCQPVLSGAFRGRKFVGPTTVERPSFSYCEAWNADAAASEMHYMALVRLRSGALLNVIASSSSATFAKDLLVFRESLSTMKVMPAR